MDEDQKVERVLGIIVCHILIGVIFLLLVNLATKSIDYVLKLETRIEKIEKKLNKG